MSDSDFHYHLPEERLTDFYNRMDQWASQQGFLFQLRNGASNSKVRGNRWIVTLFVRFLLVAFITIAGVAFWLNKRTSSPKFWDAQRDRVATVLGADEVKLSGIRYDKGRVMIRNIDATGGPDSFFKSFEGASTNFKMSMLSGLLKNWNAGAIEIDSLDLALDLKKRPGEELAKMLDTLFPQAKNFQYSYIEIKDLDMNWGSFAGDRGSIRSTHATISPNGEDSWVLKFEGGTFSQSWLRNLSLESANVLLTKDEFKIESASFKAGGRGRLQFSAQSKSTAPLEGRIRFKHLPLQNLKLQSDDVLAEGFISGDGPLSYDPFDGKGISAQLDVGLVGEDYIKVSNNIPVLQALSVVDMNRNYRSVKFNKGDFKLSLALRSAEISDLNFAVDGLMELQGQFSSKIKYEEDVRNELILSGAAMKAVKKTSSFQRNTPSKKSQAAPVGELELRLKDLPTEDTEQSPVLSDEDIERDQQEEVDSLVRREMSPVLSGEIVLILDSDVFENTRDLQEIYPKEDGNVRLPIKMDSSLLDFSREIADLLLEKGVREFKQ